MLALRWLCCGSVYRDKATDLGWFMSGSERGGVKEVVVGVEDVVVGKIDERLNGPKESQAMAKEKETDRKSGTIACSPGSSVV